MSRLARACVAGRFYSEPLDEAHLWTALRYVEQNPVRAGLVLAAEEYPWSSAAAHCGMRDDPLVSSDLPAGVRPEVWREHLAQPVCDEDLARFRGKRPPPSGGPGD